MCKEVERLQNLLREFPGMTKQALTCLHDIPPSLLYHCVEHNLVMVRQHVMGTRNGSHCVFRFYVVETGR